MYITIGACSTGGAAGPHAQAANVRGEGKGKEPAAPAGCLSRQTGCWLVCPGMHTKTDIVFLCPQTVVGQGQGSKVRGHWCSNGKSCIRYACFCLHTMVGVRVRGCPLFTPSGGGSFFGGHPVGASKWGLTFLQGVIFQWGGGVWANLPSSGQMKHCDIPQRPKEYYCTPLFRIRPNKPASNKQAST